jgi:hypothetical protein
MLRIILDGENRFTLENAAGAAVGWIHGRAIGFRGIFDESAAIRAAIDASGAMETTLAREYPGREVHDVRASRVTLVNDGAYEWIADGNRPIARILRPNVGAFPEEDFSIELQLPTYATEHVAIACAHSVWKALEQHSVAGASAPATEARPSPSPGTRLARSHVAAVGS